jgi:hypothetical protein
VNGQNLTEMGLKYAALEQAANRELYQGLSEVGQLAETAYHQSAHAIVKRTAQYLREAIDSSPRLNSEDEDTITFVLELLDRSLPPLEKRIRETHSRSHKK